MTRHIPALHFALLMTLNSAHAESPPNIVIIMADDLGWADIGVQNEEATKDVTTPNIDRLLR